MKVTDFKYAVNLHCPLVSLFIHDGKQWKFIRNSTFLNAIGLFKLERCYTDNTFLIFPFGFSPDQTWELLHRLEQH